MSESIGEATAAVITSKVTRKSTPRIAVQFEKYGVLVAWVVVIAFFSLMMPETFPTLATGRLILGTQTVILITTLGLMLSLAVGEFDLSVGSVVGFAGSLMVVLNGVLGWGALESFVTTLVAAILFGDLNAFLAVYVGVQSIIVTLGTGILTFEGAFLGQILLPNGRTVLEQAAETLLPALEGPRT